MRWKSLQMNRIEYRVWYYRGGAYSFCFATLRQHTTDTFSETLSSTVESGWLAQLFYTRLASSAHLASLVSSSVPSVDISSLILTSCCHLLSVYFFLFRRYTCESPLRKRPRPFYCTGMDFYGGTYSTPILTCTTEKEYSTEPRTSFERFFSRNISCEFSQ